MEGILSSSDSEGDADSDEISKEREEELYAVLHYNDFSKGVPPELLEKYSISTDKNNEFVISFKNAAEQFKPVSDRDDGSKPAIEQREQCTVTKVAGDLLDSSSDDSVVFVESEPTNSIKKDSLKIKSSGPSIDLTHHTPNSKSVDIQLKLSQSRIEGSEGVSIKIKKDSNPKRRHWEDGAEGKSTVNNNMNSGNTDVDTKLPPVSRKRKSADDIESSSTLSFKEFESKVAPNPKKLKSTKNDGGPELTPISDDAIETETAQDSKGRASNGGIGRNLTALSKSANELVVEEKSDSDDSSCIVVENPEINRKISVSSTESVVALMSSEDEVSGFSLNTTGDISYDSDGNVSDVIENSQFKWKEVASPSTWTQEMRKYYNSSCERLRYFDHKLIRQQIKTGSCEDWIISMRDLYPNNRPQKRCMVCRQTGHLERNCPKKDPTCHMCGVQGHSSTDCPNSICLQCGRKNRQFTSVCRSCTHTSGRECFSCKQKGHISKACPEKWREFHSTTEGPLKKNKQPRNESSTLQCCNCGKTNHTYEDCKQQFMTTLTKSLPAYNWLYGRGNNNDDWRAGFSGSSPRNAFLPSFKRRREHRDLRSFDDEFPNWRPLPIKAKHKKNKRRKKLHHSF